MREVTPEQLWHVCVWGGGGKQDDHLPWSLCLLFQAAFWCSTWREQLAQGATLGQNAKELWKRLPHPSNHLSEQGWVEAFVVHGKEISKEFPDGKMGLGQVSQVWPLPLLFPLDYSLTGNLHRPHLSLVLGHKAQQSSPSPTPRSTCHGRIHVSGSFLASATLPLTQLLAHNHAGPHPSL